MGRSLLCRNHRLKQNNHIHYCVPVPNKQGRAAVALAGFEENVTFTNARFPACGDAETLCLLINAELMKLQLLA